MLGSCVRRQWPESERDAGGGIIAQWVAREQIVQRRAAASGVADGERQARHVETLPCRSERLQRARRVSREEHRTGTSEGHVACGRRWETVEQRARRNRIARDTRLPDSQPGVDRREAAAGARRGECGSRAVRLTSALIREARTHREDGNV